MGVNFTKSPNLSIEERGGILRRFLMCSPSFDILSFLTLRDIAAAEVSICDKLDLMALSDKISGPFYENDYYFHDILWAKKRGLLAPSSIRSEEQNQSLLSIEGLHKNNELWWLVRQIPHYPHYIELAQEILVYHVCKFGIDESTVKTIVERSLSCPAHLELGLTLIRMHEEKKINLLLGGTIPAPACQGSTYLVHYAAFFGCIDLLRAVPDDSEMIVASNCHSYSPLMVAIKNNQVEAVHYLSERVDVNEQPYKMMPSYIFGGERHWADKDEMWASYEERYEERSDESAVFVAMHSSTNQEIKKIVLSHDKGGVGERDYYARFPRDPVLSQRMIDFYTDGRRVV